MSTTLPPSEFGAEVTAEELHLIMVHYFNNPFLNTFWTAMVDVPKDYWGPRLVQTDNDHIQYATLRALENHPDFNQRFTLEDGTRWQLGYYGVQPQGSECGKLPSDITPKKPMAYDAWMATYFQLCPKPWGQEIAEGLLIQLSKTFSEDEITLTLSAEGELTFKCPHKPCTRVVLSWLPDL